MRVSVSKVSKMLAEAGFIEKPFTTKDLKEGVKGFANETYGKDSHLYFYTGSKEKRKEVEKFLREEDISFDRHYDPGSGTVDIEVTYFKGFHWDE